LEGGLTANREVKSRGRRRLRRVLKVIKTVLHVGESSIHGIKVGGLGVKVEGKYLRRHRETGYKDRTEQKINPKK